jgi:hypothetical protein
MCLLNYYLAKGLLLFLTSLFCLNFNAYFKTHKVLKKRWEGKKGKIACLNNPHKFQIMGINNNKKVQVIKFARFSSQILIIATKTE